MKKHSYIQQLFFLLGGVITVVVLLLGSIAFYGKTRIEDELFFVNKRSLKQIGQGTSLKLAEYGHLSSKIANDYQIIEMLSQKEEERDGDAVERAAQEILDSYAWTYSEYNALVYTYVISRERTVYSSAYSRDTAAELVLEHFDYEGFLARPDDFFYQPTIENKEEKGVTRYTFFLIRKIKDHITGEVYGSVILNISEKNLYDTYKDLIDTGKNFYITDRNGMIISEKNKQKIGTFCGIDISQTTGEDADKLILCDDRGKESYFLYHEIPQTGWYLVETIETSELLASLGRFNFLLMAAVTGVILLLIVILHVFLKAVSEPVMAVKEKMAEVAAGNMQVSLPESGKGEFGEMARAFNYMVNQMNESMDAVKEEEKKKRLAEEEFLRAQINPHFIYNTLSSIRFFVEMNRNREAEDMLYHFSRILRKSLSNPNEFVTLGTELETIADYVELQKKRYKDSFVVEYDVDYEVLQNKIPVFILQPIVENAIFHGMTPDRICRIVIRGYGEGDRLYLIISDNGRGIKSDQLDQLFLKEGHMSKVGVQNVHERIQLNFGEEYGLKVESAEGKGTAVTFVLPRRMEC